MKVEEKENNIILTMSEQELWDLRLDLIEKVILKRDTGRPTHLLALYSLLCTTEA